MVCLTQSVAIGFGFCVVVVGMFKTQRKFSINLKRKMKKKNEKKKEQINKTHRNENVPPGKWICSSHKVKLE